MRTFISYKKLSILLVVGLAVLVVGCTSVFAENIDPSDDGSQYAQLRDVDYDGDSANDQINFEPTGYGMTVSDSGTSGYIWGETTGWINTNPTNGNVALTCSDDVATLTGYWWGEAAGWINLNPTRGGITIDTTTGTFSGDAWSQNFGWIKFDCGSASSCVKTSYTCPQSTITSSGSSAPPSSEATCSLEASESQITAGSPVTISWDTSILDGQYTKAEISPIGKVDGDAGSVVTYPSSTTTFEAVFKGNFVHGTATCDTTVTVVVGEAVVPQQLEEQDQSGCTDVSAVNYYAQATTDDGSCVYQTQPKTPIVPTEVESEPQDAPSDDSDAEQSSTTQSSGVADDETQQLSEEQQKVSTVTFSQQRFTTREGKGSVVLTVVRQGSSSGKVQAVIEVQDNNATQGSDYTSVKTYTLVWEDGDTSSREIIIPVLDDEETEGREKFSARIVSVIGGEVGPVAFAAVSIRDNDGIPAEAAAAASAVAALVAGVSTLPFRIQNILLAIPGYRRRHRPWGTVYDSESKQPLDPAYVQLLDEDGNEVASSITDLDGRYSFLAKPGVYKLQAGKTNYSFPSQELEGKNQDNMYTGLYFGGRIEVTDEEQVISKDIPMDATGDDWNEQAKRSMKVAQFFSRNDGIAHRIIDILFVAGLAMSIYAAVAMPVWYNFAILAVYAALVVVMVLGVKTRAYGIVRDSSGKPLQGAIVRAFNAHLDKEVAHRMVGENGAYHMLVQKGEYYITVEAPDDSGEMKHVYSSDAFTVNSGVIKKSIRVPQHSQ